MNYQDYKNLRVRLFANEYDANNFLSIHEDEIISIEFIPGKHEGSATICIVAGEIRFL